MKYTNKGVMRLYKFSRICYLKRIPVIPKIIKGFIRVFYGATVPYKADIGDGTCFPHGGSGVIIHEEAKIGNHCIIQANAVIGGRSGLKGAPQIGDEVLIGAGAAVLGKIKIGNGAKIGANAVVLKDVGENCIAVGVPAVIKK